MVLGARRAWPSPTMHPGDSANCFAGSDVTQSRGWGMVRFKHLGVWDWLRRQRCWRRFRLRPVFRIPSIAFWTKCSPDRPSRRRCAAGKEPVMPSAPPHALLHHNLSRPLPPCRNSTCRRCRPWCLANCRRLRWKIRCTRIFCVEYARARSGLAVFGDAKFWWTHAKDLYARVSDRRSKMR